MYESFGLIGIQLSEKYKDVPSTHALFNRAWWKRRSTEYGVGVRSTECGVRSAEYGVRSAECGVRSAECGVRSTPYFNIGKNMQKVCLELQLHLQLPARFLVAICNVNTPRL